MIKNEKLDNLYYQKKLIERKKLELKKEELTLLMELANTLVLFQTCLRWDLL